MSRFFLFVLLNIVSGQTFAQSQRQMIDDALANYKKADNELNSIYKRILQEYKSDTVFINNLKTAQRFWIQFRDAEMKARFPESDKIFYGSVQPICWYSLLTELTEERIAKLKIWLIGVEEGNICSGSVKLKE